MSDQQPGDVPAQDRVEIDRKLLEALVCPMTRGPLVYDAERQELISKGASRAYPIRDGIPIMLVEEAEVAGLAEFDRVMAEVDRRPQTDDG